MDGYTPLNWAASEGQLEVVRFLLEKGAAIDVKTMLGRTPLHWAASEGHLEIVRLLLTKGAAIDVKTKKGETPLMLAEKDGHGNIAQLLREALRVRDDQAKLFHALDKKRFVDATRILEQETIDPNLCDSNGTSLVQLVLATQDLPLVHALVKKPNLNDKTTRALAKSPDAAKALFLHAVATNDASMVHQLLSLGISPTLTNEHGDIALHLAAASGHVAIVTSLLKVAKDETYVNAINHLGHTPLHVAAAKGHAGVVESLLDANANVFAMTTSGETPLMLTTDDHVVAILQRAKAKANMQRRPQLVDAVCKRDYRQTMALVTDGVSPNAMNEEGDSLLHLAVQRNDHKVLDALVRAPDIKMDVQSAAGMTPMILAIRLGHRRLATMLQAAAHSEVPEVSESEIEMDISSPLGAGGYGAVYKGMYNGRTVAIKTAVNASCIQALIYEMETMQLCNSPYVLQLLAVSRSSSPKLVLEYMDAGDLRSYLDAKRLGQPTKVDVSPLDVAWVLANALADLHHNGLLHRDLKSHNVLLSSTNYIKLADLGIAREYESIMTTAKGTPYWTAPEVFTSDSHYSFAADIYSFGVILTELDTLQLPFHDVKGLRQWDIMDGVRLGNLRPTVSANSPPWLRHLADACLSFDPTQRPSAQMLVTSLQKLLGRSKQALAQEPETEPLDRKTRSTAISTPENLHRSDKLLSRTSSTVSSGSVTSSVTSGASTGTTTYSSWSNSMLVSTRVVCQLCRASNSLLQTHCEACAGSLAPVASKLKVLLKRLAVAKKNGFEIDDGLVCVCCETHHSMTATICDECDDELPDDQEKLRILVLRIEQAANT
ncbi:TKL protein kinase, variant 1 [Saprolegnia diclina VS20]|nr:TKL protein kinase, variant 1 [Saprolegnia diclina VS20]EQC30461.1 TKL protein kinase, variant 1 [Saprolegnia diclina VS20]|eukprot:XP_008616054.1 TKL protein kinase, variant 1 [Saprolegnia diclina VS20]